VTVRDISHEYKWILTARTSEGEVVAVAGDDIEAVRGADVLVLRTGSGVRAARFVGAVPTPLAGLETVELAGAYVVASDGIRLSELIATPDPGVESPGSRSGHEWGALGLPDGPETRVLPLGAPGLSDDVAAARASAGFAALAADPLLAVSPGDRVAVRGVTRTVVAVDRRERTMELDADGQPVVERFDEIHTMEQDR
jgi:hypothetical protein